MEGASGGGGGMTVRLEGAEELLEGFRSYPAAAKLEVTRALHKALMLLQSAASDYPPGLMGSRYRRTGTLGRLWTVARPQVREVRGHVLEGRVGNRTPYGPYVQDPDAQVEVHRGRWATTDEIVREHEEEIGALLSQAGANIVREMAGE